MVPSPVLHISERDHKALAMPAVVTNRPLKRSYALLGERFPLKSILRILNFSTDVRHELIDIPNIKPRKHKRIQNPQSDHSILMRLNSWGNPGVPQDTFRDLLGRMVTCGCGLVMMRKIVDTHYCGLKKRFNTRVRVAMVDSEQLLTETDTSIDDFDSTDSDE